MRLYNHFLIKERAIFCCLSYNINVSLLLSQQSYAKIFHRNVSISNWSIRWKNVSIVKGHTVQWALLDLWLCARLLACFFYETPRSNSSNEKLISPNVISGMDKNSFLHTIMMPVVATKSLPNKESSQRIQK